jgi:hypothetical protein
MTSPMTIPLWLNSDGMGKRAHDPQTGLTPRQEKFCRGLAEGLSQAAAFRAAFGRSKGWKPQTVHSRASELAAQGKVQGRVAELQAELRQRSGYDLDRAMRETDEALRLAEAQRNPAAMVAVITLRARMNGLLAADRRNERRPLAYISDEDLDAAIERLQAEINGGFQ